MFALNKNRRLAAGEVQGSRPVHDNAHHRRMTQELPKASEDPAVKHRTVSRLSLEGGRGGNECEFLGP